MNSFLSILLFFITAGANLLLGFAAGCWLLGYRLRREGYRLTLYRGDSAFLLRRVAPQANSISAPVERAEAVTIPEPEMEPPKATPAAVSKPGPEEQLLADLLAEHWKWRERLPQLDEFLRDESADPRDFGIDEQIIERLLTQIRDLRTVTVERLVVLIPEAGVKGNLYHEARQTLDAAAERAKRASEELSQLSPDDSLPKWRKQVRQTLDDLLDAADRIAQAFAVAAVNLAQRRDAEALTVDAFRHDAATGLAGRAEALTRWNNSCETAESPEPRAVAAIDLDLLREVNTTAGLLAGDRLVAVIGELVRSEIQGDLVARAAGGRFWILPQSASAEEIGGRMERIRQRIEATQFMHASGRLPVTVSSAVVFRQPGEAAADVIRRLDTTLAEAKSYGRNRTFLNEHENPVPLVPPELSLAPTTVSL